MGYMGVVSRNPTHLVKAFKSEDLFCWRAHVGFFMVTAECLCCGFGRPGIELLMRRPFSGP